MSNCTDEEFLNNYYNTVYLSPEYTAFKKADSAYDISSMKEYKAYDKLEAYCQCILPFIYIIIFIAIKTAIYPIFLINIIFFLIFFVKNKKYKKLDKIAEKLEDEFLQCDEAFKALVKKTEKPDLPEDKLNPKSIEELLEIFKSKQAETYKEALIILEQNKQQQEQINYQKDLQNQVFYAQQRAQQAELEAEKAKKEAEYQRQEAERRRRDAEYQREYERREMEYWNNH